MESALSASRLAYPPADRARYEPYGHAELYDALRRSVPANHLHEPVDLPAEDLPADATWSDVLDGIRPPEDSLAERDRGVLRAVDLLLFYAIKGRQLQSPLDPGFRRSVRDPAAFLVFVGEPDPCVELVTQFYRCWEGQNTAQVEMRAYDDHKRMLEDPDLRGEYRVLTVFVGDQEEASGSLGLAGYGDAARAALGDMEVFVAADDGAEDGHLSRLCAAANPLWRWNLGPGCSLEDVARQLNRVWYRNPYADALEAASRLAVRERSRMFAQMAYALRSSRPGAPNADRARIRSWMLEALEVSLQDRFGT